MKWSWTISATQLVNINYILQNYILCLLLITINDEYSIKMVEKTTIIVIIVANKYKKYIFFRLPFEKWMESNQMVDNLKDQLKKFNEGRIKKRLNKINFDDHKIRGENHESKTNAKNIDTNWIGG